jgi:hypothetical protein
LDLQIENLPELKNELIAQYRLEKQESLKIAENRNHVKERESENFELFMHKVPYTTLSDAYVIEKDNVSKEQSEKYSGRMFSDRIRGCDHRRQNGESGIIAAAL